MWTWIKSNPLKAAVLAALAVLTAWATVEEITGSFDQPRAHSERGSESEYGAPSFSLSVTDQGTTYRYQPQAEEHQEPDWWGIPFEGWVALSTILLFASTTGLWIATHGLGERADRGMRALERPFVFPFIASSMGDVASRIEKALDQGDPEFTLTVALGFKLKNYGKTAATLTAIETLLFVNDDTIRTGAQADLPAEQVLGSNDETREALFVSCEITRAQAGNILMGQDHLLLHGFVNYLDIWGDEIGQTFLWRYEHRLRRFVPVSQKKKYKDK